MVEGNTRNGLLLGLYCQDAIDIIEIPLLVASLIPNTMTNKIITAIRLILNTKFIISDVMTQLVFCRKIIFIKKSTLPVFYWTIKCRIEWFRFSYNRCKQDSYVTRHATCKKVAIHLNQNSNHIFLHQIFVNLHIC